MPGEWEPHRATWISWPHHEPDWPGKLGPIPWVYAEIARVLSAHEQVEILCQSDEVRAAAQAVLASHGVAADRLRLHLVATDRVWLRDSAPTAVHDDAGKVVLVDWVFNGWAKYDNWKLDVAVGPAIARITGLPTEQPQRPDGRGRVVLEGGGIEVNGEGLLLVTEEWLLSDTQVRNPGLTRTDYERVFADWLGIRQTIWLGEGCVGDDTHGHVDDIARFVSRDTVVLAVEEDPADENHARSIDNVRRLELASQSGDDGSRLRIVKLPFAVHGDRPWERRTASSQLREFLHRQRRDTRAYIQRRKRSNRAEHAGRADAVTSRDRHSRGRSGVGAWHSALPDAAGAAGKNLTGPKVPRGA